MNPKCRFWGGSISSFASLWLANDAFSELFGFRSNMVFSKTVYTLLMILIVILFSCIYWYLTIAVRNRWLSNAKIPMKFL